MPIVADGCRMICYGLLLLAIVNGEWGSDIVPFVVLVIVSTLMQRTCEHLLAAKKARYGNQFKGRFRSELFDKLFFLGPAFIERKTTGEIITTLWEKVEWISYYLYYYIPTSWAILLFSLICALVGVFIQPLLSLAIVFGGVLVTSMPILFRGILKESGNEEWDESDEFYSVCLDGLRGIVTLKALNANEIHRKKVEEQAEINRKKIMQNLQRTTLNTRAIDLLISAGEFCFIGLGVWYAARSNLSNSHILMLFMIAGAWAEGAKRVFGAWLRGNKGISAFDRAAEILDAESPYSLAALEETANHGLMPFNDLTIVFDQVTFSYAVAAEPAIKDFSLTIKPGTKTALVGSSGSGKSSIIRLLFGFYKPEIGTILIGNVPLDAHNVKQIQKMMTVIWQDCHVFHMSCLDNIRIARPEATDEEVYAAAEQANIHEKIMSLPNGYQTVIGDGGTAFSGGEKQRISLARAFLRNAPILILDEATSSLDRKNEQEIQACIAKLGEGKSVLTIAHRLDTIRNADQICVMDAGRIVEKGTHAELLNLGARYCELMGRDPEKRGYDHE